MFESNIIISLKLNTNLTLNSNVYILSITNVVWMFEKCQVFNGSENIEKNCLFNIRAKCYYFFKVKYLFNIENEC